MTTRDPHRRDYDGPALLESEIASDPFVQFQLWFDEVVAAGARTANAMTLATVSEAGAPEARIVLLKEFDADGFVFFTNYLSAKARSLEATAQASLLFYWERFERQVRIDGTTERVSDADSDAYFATRPRAANIGAMASRQSTVVRSREVLQARVDDLTAEWEGRELVRPSTWGGYRVLPQTLEFWQGRPDRLHDRLRFTRDGGDWRLERLSP